VGALVSADLVDALSGDGPFTVFAPTNDAFAAISSVVAGLTKEQLAQVLEYHVVDAEAKAEDLSNMESLFPLYRGHSLGVNLEEVDAEGHGKVRIVGENNAVTVTTANVLCTNGVVHIVDAVLLPNLNSDEVLASAAPSQSIVETAQSVPQLSSLVDALVKADLVDALSGPGPFTVLAPTNDAFDAISSVVAGLTTDQLRFVLEYHVVSGAAAKASDLANNEVLIPLASGRSWHVNLDVPGEVRFVGETNYVTVTTADVLCSNGVVHIVDAVLIPVLSETSLAAAAPMSIVETAQATPQLSSLVEALVQADLVDALSGDGPFTVFAPTNDAFAAISSVVAGLTKEQLAQVLEYHVVDTEAKAEDLYNMQSLFPLLRGHSLGVNLEEGPGRVRIVGENNAVTVTTANVLCTNGVVHVVDAVLIPNLNSGTTVV
jgi:transforming growth factor-beta-induced protein